MDLFPGTVVVGALAEHPESRPKPRLFLARRGPSVPHPDLWELPGGKVEAGEEPAAALLRELREELGLEARILSGPRIYEESVEGRSFRFIVYAVDLGGEPRRLAAHDLWAWFEPCELGGLTLAPLDRRPVELWAAEKISLDADFGLIDPR